MSDAAPFHGVQLLDEPNNLHDVPFHAVRLLDEPRCSKDGILPTVMLGWEHSDAYSRGDNQSISNTTWSATAAHARVSDVVGKELECLQREYIADRASIPAKPKLREFVSRVQIALAGGGGVSPVLAFEAGCNMGKSYAVHHELIRPLLLKHPRLPMLHISVRITHADDLLLACKEYYKDDNGRPIKGLDLRSYRGEAMYREATQLIISPQMLAKGKFGETARFGGGLLVLDEVMSLALSVGATEDKTITDHNHLAAQLRELVKHVAHVIVLDRDITLTPIVARLLDVIAPGRDVVDVRFLRSAQSNRFCYVFNSQCARASSRTTRNICALCPPTA